MYLHNLARSKTIYGHDTIKQNHNGPVAMRRCNAKLSRYIGDSGKQYTIPPLVLELQATLHVPHSYLAV